LLLYCPYEDLHSFPTRRSSDLADGGGNHRVDPVLQAQLAVVEADPPVVHEVGGIAQSGEVFGEAAPAAQVETPGRRRQWRHEQQDRKSTRLNSSHQISPYAVFC